MNTANEAINIGSEARDLSLENRKRWQRALIIEDDLSMCAVLEGVLEEISPGIEIEWSSSGEEAAFDLRREGRLSGESPFDVVIADIFLEGNATGLDIWRMCRDFFPDAQVIVTSALPRDKFLRIISDDTEYSPPPYLAKPFSIRECKDTLEELMTEQF